jgi:hypothetical protein
MKMRVARQRTTQEELKRRELAGGEGFEPSKSEPGYKQHHMPFNAMNKGTKRHQNIGSKLLEIDDSPNLVFQAP